MRLCLVTQGCRANKADSGWMEALATRNNFQLVDQIVEADAVVINTCTVTHGADRDCRQWVSRVNRLNPDAVVCLVGCLTQVDPGKPLAWPGVDYIGGSSAKSRVIDFLATHPGKQLAPYRDEQTFQEEGFLRADVFPASSRNTRLFLKIQDGCNHACTYCIIPTARGPSKSLSMPEVLNLLQQAELLGYREAVLTGIDLGSFGGGVNTSEGLLALLQAIEVHSGLDRIRLSSLSPRELPDELIHFVARSKRICPSFHISLQHGSTRILRAMGRPYRPELFRTRTELIHKLMPDAGVSFDVIVGFPGETEDDFAELTTLLETTPWMQGHFFPYSAREGTASARYQNRVASTAKTERMERLLSLSDQRFRQSLALRTGQGVDVLLEQERTLPEGKYFFGYTRGYLPVIVPGNGADLRNEIVRVKATRVQQLESGAVLAAETGLPSQEFPLVPAAEFQASASVH